MNEMNILINSKASDLAMICPNGHWCSLRPLILLPVQEEINLSIGFLGVAIIIMAGSVSISAGTLLDWGLPIQ